MLLCTDCGVRGRLRFVMGDFVISWMEREDIFLIYQTAVLLLLEHVTLQLNKQYTNPMNNRIHLNITKNFNSYPPPNMSCLHCKNEHASDLQGSKHCVLFVTRNTILRMWDICRVLGNLRRLVHIATTVLVRAKTEQYARKQQDFYTTQIKNWQIDLSFYTLTLSITFLKIMIFNAILYTEDLQLSKRVL
jgi:hypothetical protein